MNQSITVYICKENGINPMKCENCGAISPSPSYRWKGKFINKPKDHDLVITDFLILCADCKFDFVSNKDEWFGRLRK